MRLQSIIFGCLLFGGSSALRAIDSAAPPLDFNRDVRPIFVNNCFKCHGPGAHNDDTKFRLYSQKAAFIDLGGYHAIVPGKPKESPLYRRITSTDDSQHMPPPSSGLKLTAAQIATIRQWIAQGAHWEKYWAFQPIQRPALPAVRDQGWPKNEIDRFILARQEKAGLRPSAPADRRTLIRRVTLDLTGLPPTPAEVEAFLDDSSPAAYERLVDRLLASPHYGENMARDWLDAARYGDTHGMHFDNKRSIWPYRDWVVAALNRNLPFDQFTIDQLAGDLLPHPTREQLVATGFNRCNITSNEGGSIPQELWVRYTKDRAMTVGTVWLGLTVGCAQCHNHKYDPIKQKDFYKLYAFFYNMADKPMDGNAYLPPPSLELPTPAEQKKLDAYDRQIESVRQDVLQEIAKVQYTPRKETEHHPLPRREYVWLDDHLPDGATPKGSGDLKAWPRASRSDHPVYSGEYSFVLKGGTNDTSQLFFDDAKDMLRIGQGDRLFVYAYLDAKDPPREIMLQFNDGSWEHRVAWGKDLIDWGKKGSPSRRLKGALPENGSWVRLEVAAADVGLKPGSTLKGWSFTQKGGTVYWDKAGIDTETPQGHAGFGSLLTWEDWLKDNPPDSLPKDIQKVLKLKPEKRTGKEQRQLRDYFVEYVYSKSRAVFDPLHAKLAKLQSERKKFNDGIPATLITRRAKKVREAHLLIRGAYDNPGPKVEPGIPAFLNPWPKGAPTNRLGLAEWLLDPKNPLTARVVVNRYWQHYFGKGIVKSAENFGALGDLPTHPELLDWLASEFIRSGWNVKHLQRLIVMSATYRQSSKTSPARLKADPANLLYTRGPRFRLDAEVIRDYALFVSGLLVNRVGGPPVKPYQPPGLWKAVAYQGSNTMLFKKDEGAKLYRRSLYTFWKRTMPPPNMMAFDTPTREECTVRRERTDTPLQALVLMNDVQFVEAARHLAARIMTEGGSSPEKRIRWVFQVVLSRPPSEKELRVLLNLYQDELKHYRADPQAAKELLETGDSPNDSALDNAHLAAWTIVGNTMLNLTETISKG